MSKLRFVLLALAVAVLIIGSYVGYHILWGRLS
jgi:hypothetical protein